MLGMNQGGVVIAAREGGSDRFYFVSSNRSDELAALINERVGNRISEDTQSSNDVDGSTES